MTMILYPIIVCASLGLGCAAGILIERIRWNALIEQGKIPRPH